MQMQPAYAGIGSLAYPQGMDQDSMLVQMTPREVGGLQALARAHGATEEDLYDPVTGQPRFGFLKNLIPMIAGAILGPGGAGVFQSSLTAAAAVGIGYGLVEGDLKKGLMAGLGAYSGSNIASGLKAAAAATPADQVTTAPPTQSLVRLPQTPTGTQSVGDISSALNKQQILGGPAPSVLQPQTVTQAPPLPVPTAPAAPAPSGFSQYLQGAQKAFGTKEGANAFMGAMGGGFESPFAQNLSRYATTAGVLGAFAPDEQQIPTAGSGEETMYMPGALNPKYGTSALEPLYLPGRYYKKTAKGLVPFNPFQKAPGYAAGGMVAPPDQYMNQQRQLPNQNQNMQYPMQPRQIPDQSSVMPYPNQNYPLSTVVQSSYSSQPINRPQAQEVISGYEPKINPYTGEEKFADGGAVDENDLVAANKAYVEDLNRRAKNPMSTPYGMVLGSKYTPGTYTGGTPYGDWPTGDTEGATPQGAIDPVTGLLAAYGAQKAFTAALPYAQTALGKFGIGPKATTPTPADGTAPAGTAPAGTAPAGTAPAGTAPAGGAGAGASAGAATPYYLQGGSGIEAAGLQGLTAEQLAQLPAGAGIDTLMKAGFDTGALTPGLSALTPQQLVQLPENELMKMGLDPKVVQSIKADSLAGKVIPGAQTALGLYTMYKGIEQGKAGQAALGGYGAGAGIASLAGSNLAPILGMNPIGLGLAALAAIGSTLVQKNEFGEVALRNYWRGVDQGRSIGQSDPTELAQGFINFYRTNKNNFPGQAKYGRTGNEDFMYDMTQVINNAVEKGEVPKDATPDVILKQVVQPWLDTMGPGPQHPDARRVQNYMMTDLINSFMQGKPISNAQVKGDSKFKIVSEKPTYLGVPPKPAEPPAVQTGIPEARNPYGYGDMQFADGGAIGDDYNFGFARGGVPGEYKAGGKLLNGPGDGMSDDIPAVIRGKRTQRAALADGEFVIPADVVSHLGNGSTKAGAKKLYQMMSKVRQARTGRSQQAPAVRTERFLPA